MTEVIHTVTSDIVKKLVLTIAFISTISITHGRVGLSESTFETPGGHLICDCDSMTDWETNAPSILGYGDKIPRVKEFYFYKNHVIGYTDSLYFIFDEEGETLLTFINKDKWKQELEEGGLDPIITRWLDVSDSPEDVFLILYLSFLISVPVMLTFTYFLIKTLIRAIKREGFSIKYGNNTRAFVALSVLLIWFLSELFWLESV